MPARTSPQRSEATLNSLFATLDAGGIVVTANNRSAAWIRAAYDAAQRARGSSIWPSPQVMPWSAWLRTLWQRSRSAEGSSRDRLLMPWQARRLWSDAVGEHAHGTLVHADNAVELAMKAWEIVHGWNGPWAQWGGEGARDEQRAFVQWAGSFTRRCGDSGWIDAPRLPLVLIDAARKGTLAVGEKIALFGFAELSPRQQQLIDAFAQRGTPIESARLEDGRDAANRVPPTARRVACVDPSDELRRCAQWCRSLLAKSPGERIGVVVPDLAHRRSHVERVFAEMLAPQLPLGGGAPHGVYNLSQGEPLSAQSLVAVALTALRWTRSPIDLARLSALARSSYLGTFTDEQPARAALVRAAIDEPYDEWPLVAFAQFAARRAPAWAQSLRAMATTAADWHRRRTAKEWRTAWEAALQAAGFLADHPLDSVEFQLRRAWSELLNAWMRAESIAGALSFDQALKSIEGLAETTIHQPESGDAAVQVLGFLEAAGLQFDSLWVCGLTAERWPPAPVPNPLLPIAWQKAVGAPHASAERELEYFRTLTMQFANAADAVVFSWPATIDDIPQTPSPLLFGFPEVTAFDLLDRHQPGLAELLRGSGRLESTDDCRGVGIPLGANATGPSGLIEAQAHCPFHAYARFRLRTEPWPQQRTGLDPLERGSLVHCMLAEFWNGTPDQHALADLPSNARCERIAASVATAMEKTISSRRWDQLGDAMRDIERARLVALLDEWLAFEATRPPFAVVGSEVKHQLAVDRLALRLRVDRIDHIDDGGSERLIVIDYKTGNTKTAVLQTAERMVSPQLPLYAEAMAPADVAAVAYGTVRRGECGASGIGDLADEWDAIRPAVPDWPERRAQWRNELSALAREYLDGEATVDPWRVSVSCDRCHRQALCRINERLAFVPGSDSAAQDASSEVK